MIQLTMVARGVMVALCLTAFAYPIAWFYRAPQLTWPLVFFGLSSLITGFLHLDMRRIQRQSDFRSEGHVTLRAEIFGFLATIAAAYFLRNFTAVLYGQVARAALMVIGSHVRSHRRYQIAYVSQHAARLAAFHCP